MTFIVHPVYWYSQIIDNSVNAIDLLEIHNRNTI